MPNFPRFAPYITAIPIFYQRFRLYPSPSKSCVCSFVRSLKVDSYFSFFFPLLSPFLLFFLAYSFLSLPPSCMYVYHTYIPYIVSAIYPSIHPLRFHSPGAPFLNPIPLYSISLPLPPITLEPRSKSIPHFFSLFLYTYRVRNKFNRHYNLSI